MISSTLLAAELSGDAPRSMGRKAARGALWTTAQSLVMRLSGLVAFLVLARLLVPADFGLVAAAQVFVALSRVLAEHAMTRTLVQRSELRAAHLDSALVLSGGLGLALSIVLVASAPLVAALYDMSGLTPLLMALGVVPLFAGLSSVPESILRRQLRFRSVAMRGMVSVVMSGGIGIGLALAGAGVWALVAQTISQALIALVVLWASVRWRPGRAWERGAVAELMGFGVHVLGISLLSFVNRRAGELIIGITLGPVALGLFAVGVKILTLCLDLVVTNIQKVALPVFSRVAADPPRLADAYLRLTSFTTLVAFPGFTLLALFGHQLTPLIFGSQWADAGPLMSILALIGPVQSIAQFNNTVMLATGASGLALRWVATTAALNTIGFLVFSRYGVEAAAIGYVAVAWLLLPVGLYLVRRVSAVTVRGQLATLAVPLAGCTAMILTVGGIRLITDFSVLAEVLVAGALGLLSYVAVALPFRKELLASVVRQLRSKGAKPLQRVAAEPER